jgi:hypothetical protein
MVLFEAAMVTREHWQRQLSPAERERVSILLRKSKGRPSNLDQRERAELREMLGKLDVKEIGMDMLPFVGQVRRQRRR